MQKHPFTIIKKQNIVNAILPSETIAVTGNKDCIVDLLFQQGKEICCEKNQQYFYSRRVAEECNVLYFSNAKLIDNLLHGILEYQCNGAPLFANLMSLPNVPVHATYDLVHDKLELNFALMEPVMLNKVFFATSFAHFANQQLTAKSITLHLCNRTVTVNVQLIDSVVIPITNFNQVKSLEYSGVQFEYSCVSEIGATTSYLTNTIEFATSCPKPSNAVLCVSEELVPVKAYMDLSGWKIRYGDFVEDNITSQLILKGKIWKALEQIIGPISGFTLHGWTISCDYSKISTYGRIIFKEPMLLPFDLFSTSIMQIDYSCHICYFKCSPYAFSLSMDASLAFKTTYNYHEQFTLAKPILQQFGCIHNCSEFYKYLNCSEFTCALTGKMISNTMKILGISDVYVTLAPQKVLYYAFYSQWEVTIPSRYVFLEHTSANEYDVNCSKISYASWKFYWLYSTTSTTICTTSSSSSVQLSASNINLTFHQLFHLAKRKAPATIGSDLLASTIASLTLDVVKLIIEAKNQHITVTWNNQTDQFMYKCDTKFINAEYDTHRKLLASFPFQDVVFELWWWK